MVEQKALAFRHEFYKQPEVESSQIRDDVVSYLGEYRFKVTEFDYRLGLRNGRLVDPNTGQFMVDKARRSIEIRKTDYLRTEREEAELQGLFRLEEQLKENPLGTALWFSPPGPKEEGYGEYGFAYLGVRKDDKLEMKAVRLENPNLSDFNTASQILWGIKYERAEDFLRSPQVLNISQEDLRNFVQGIFNIRKDQSRNIFQNALGAMRDKIEDFIQIVKFGSEDQKEMAFRALENFAIEFNRRQTRPDNTIFFSDRVGLRELMKMPNYQVKPQSISGSCGSSGRAETNDIFRSINGSISNNLYNKDQEHFTCPRCKKTAEGPIGNTCPSCGLTKEKFVKDGGEACE